MAMLVCGSPSSFQLRACDFLCNIQNRDSARFSNGPEVPSGWHDGATPEVPALCGNRIFDGTFPLEKLDIAY